MKSNTGIRLVIFACDLKNIITNWINILQNKTLFGKGKES